MNGVGQAVGEPSQGSRRVGEAVHHAQAGLRKGDTGHGGSLGHARSRLHIVAAPLRSLQIFADKPHRFQAEKVGHGVVASAHIGFDRVGEGVHARGGGEFGRHGYLEEGIDEGEARKEGLAGRAFLYFPAAFHEGEDGGVRHFRARARRRGNREEGRNGSAESEPRADEVANGASLADCRADAFGAVEGASAAVAEDRVAAFIPVERRIPRRPCRWRGRPPAPA